ncbi:MAG TPA: hypothetical protein VFT22_25470 [Kofleriaceae bacterium]|nr:hypothetical protein [Kofleriaceae bacterium]
MAGIAAGGGNASGWSPQVSAYGRVSSAAGGAGGAAGVVAEVAGVVVEGVAGAVVAGAAGAAAAVVDRAGGSGEVCGPAGRVAPGAPRDDVGAGGALAPLRVSSGAGWLRQLPAIAATTSQLAREGMQPS